MISRNININKNLVPYRIGVSEKRGKGGGK